MTEYGLEPAFVKLDYVSPYAPHSMLLPTRAWLPTSITGNMGSYVAWNDDPIDAEEMIDALVAKLKVFHKPTTSFSLATIFTKPLETDPALPVAIKALAVVGTSAAVGASKAIQQTWNFRTAGTHPAKLTFLDAPMGDNVEFDRVTLLGFNADALSLVNEFCDVANAWSGRDNTRVANAIGITFTVNEALRKQYHMG